MESLCIPPTRDPIIHSEQRRRVWLERKSNDFWIVWLKGHPLSSFTHPSIHLIVAILFGWIGALPYLAGGRGLIPFDLSCPADTMPVLFRATFLLAVAVLLCRRAALAQTVLLRRAADATSVAEKQATTTTTDLAQLSSLTFDRRRKLQSVDVVGDNGSPSGAYPLSLCQGDCDTDDDCQGDLVCFLRDGGDAVPGCSGGESENAGADVCVNRSGGGEDDEKEEDPVVVSSSGGERGYLKMHWESDYYWQGESEQRKWCVACDGGCDDGNRVEIDDCDDGDPTAVYLERMGNGVFRIRASGSDVCLEVPDDLDDYTSWETCSASEDLQRWTGRNGDAFGGGRFELVPASLPGYCLTQTHDPKRGERLWVSTCDYARKDHTSYWEMY